MVAEDGMKIYKGIFKKIFPNIAEADYAEMKVGDPMEWDSLHHIQLVSALEKEFSIQFGMDGIVRFRSFQQGIELLREKSCIR